MSILSQLFNKNGDKIDPINHNYEVRLKKLENNVYSTVEYKTGKKWYDGSDIYGRVFILENEILIQTGTWKNILDVSGLNIQAITDIKLLNNNNWFWTGTITRVVNNYLQLASVGRDNTDWYLKTIVLEYTKSSN